MSRMGREAPKGREAVEEIVTDHLPRFGQVLTDAWGAFSTTREQAAPQMAFASASSRGMLVSDFTHEPAHRIFASIPDGWVDDRYGRPWVNLGGGSVQVRFRKLTSDLALCCNDSDRATSLAYHLGDPVLPGIDPATILTAGYVLDLAEREIARLALVCHVGKEVYYTFPIPAAAATSANQPTAESSGQQWVPSQLSLTPLSPPIIRSAQQAAAERLASGQSDSVHPSAAGRVAPGVFGSEDA